MYVATLDQEVVVATLDQDVVAALNQVVATLNQVEAVETLGNEAVLGAREVAAREVTVGSQMLPIHLKHRQVVKVSHCLFFQSY